MRASHNCLRSSRSREHTDPCCRGCPQGCGKHQHDCHAQSCQPHLEESDMTHMALAGLCWAARLCARGELAGIHGRILECHWSREEGEINEKKNLFTELHAAILLFTDDEHYFIQELMGSSLYCTNIQSWPFWGGGTHLKQVFTHPSLTQAVLRSSFCSSKSVARDSSTMGGLDQQLRSTHCAATTTSF